MLFETGFLGTDAPLYLDVVTLYFSLLPFLLAGSIYLAVRKQFVLHYRSQIMIFFITVAMILLFEISVRIDGGFLEFSKQSSFSMTFLSIFLAIHILIAVLSVILWVIVLYTSYREYQAERDREVFARVHKRKTHLLFSGLTVTSVMGVMIYLFLFVW